MIDESNEIPPMLGADVQLLHMAARVRATILVEGARGSYHADVFSEKHTFTDVLSSKKPMANTLALEEDSISDDKKRT
jgi:hypothetical protein